MRGNMAKLLATLPQQGRLEQILVRPARDEAMLSLPQAEVVPGQGIVGDRFSGRLDSKRQVTLFQAEMLGVLASLLHVEFIDPRLLRRNLLVSGISLQALSGRRFRIGEVVLAGAGQCHPCSRMEKALGPGGFNAMRGIGGLCARVVEGGAIRVGDRVIALEDHEGVDTQPLQ
ncbi:molybdenum cofactor sulfurase [Marinobacterium nitratireducens]|uniref:Molybdenum cofactor sulfurase n=1 Tax=Marinobacterium nitratireducens TaxID=518897 RepID=A0A918DWF7_9GAMM|nr:MOSC domain-containing protein [Marinobacterium nitratireducens]GGO86632.1 molybdenum cofactor sulfurase [Marinobacterium nitratireducens]